MEFIKKHKRDLVFLAVVLILAVMPFNLSLFRLNMLGKFVAYAIVAIGLDLLWGYTGILSLGHGVFFGLGAYCMGMYLKLQATGGGLPDFMQWNGVSVLPDFWKPFSNTGMAMALIVAVPVLLALVLGLVTFINRIRGVYFSILSQALALVFVTVLTGTQKYTGGTNGITDFKTIFGMNINAPMTKITLFYVALAALVIVYALSSLLLSRKTGKVLVAIRDGENRAFFSGYNASNYKTFVYCLSALFAGIAGALFVPFSGIISPAELSVSASIEMVIWVAVGGRGTLIGAVIGALLVNLAKTGMSEQFPEIWSYFIGILFVVVVLFLRRGIVGLFENIGKKRVKAAPASAAKEVNA